VLNENAQSGAYLKQFLLF